jgi:anti-sigma B factor antagonist
MRTDWASASLNQVPAYLTITVFPDTTVTRVRVVGELDIATEPLLLETIDPLRRAEHDRVVADLSELTFCDARGLAALVAVHDRLAEAGIHLSLTGASAKLRRLLVITKLDQRLDLSDFPDTGCSRASATSTQRTSVPESPTKTSRDVAAEDEGQDPQIQLLADPRSDAPSRPPATPQSQH